MRRLDDALIDIAVAFRPRTKPGFKIETLYTDKLILVSSDKRGLDKSWPDDYVFVDWGESFPRRIRGCLPGAEYAVDPDPPAGGRPQPHSPSGGAPPISPVRSRIPGSRRGRLHEVRDAPFFPIPTFVVYPAEPVDQEMQSIALEGLTQLVRHRR